MSTQHLQLGPCLFQRVNSTSDDGSDIASVRQLGYLPQCSLAGPGDDDRRHTLHRWGRDVCILHAEVTPLEAEWLGSADAPDDRDGLCERLLSLAGGRVRQSHPIELVGPPTEGRCVPTNAETEHEAPVTKVFEIGSQASSEYRRSVEHRTDHRAKPDSLRGPREGSQMQPGLRLPRGVVGSQEGIELQLLRQSTGSKHALTRGRVIAAGFDLQGEADPGSSRRHP